MNGLKNVNRIFVGKPQWKKPLDRYRNKWQITIKMYLKAIGCEDMIWICSKHGNVTSGFHRS
jgi:hypothetical protein